jgi:hypothetical protein
MHMAAMASIAEKVSLSDPELATKLLSDMQRDLDKEDDLIRRISLVSSALRASSHLQSNVIAEAIVRSTLSAGVGAWQHDLSIHTSQPAVSSTIYEPLVGLVKAAAEFIPAWTLQEVRYLDAREASLLLIPAAEAAFGKNK